MHQRQPMQSPNDAGSIHLSANDTRTPGSKRRKIHATNDGNRITTPSTGAYPVQSYVLYIIGGTYRMTEFNFGIFKKFQTALIQALLETPAIRSHGKTTEIQRKRKDCNGLETQKIKNMIFLTASPCWKVPWNRPCIFQNGGIHGFPTTQPTHCSFHGGESPSNKE
jgi:hypothetical protein